jgi:tetratricopeptide (TPR) repeat protein
MMRWILGAVLLAVSLPASAQPLGIATERSAELLWSGRTQMEKGRMEAAEDSLRRLAARPDGRAAAFHGLATVSLYQFFFTESSAYADRFFRRADSLDAAIETMRTGRWRRLARAEETLMRSMAYGREGRYVRAAWYARTAAKKLEALHADHPSFADAKFALGLVHFFVGVLPRREQWVLSILGFNGDAEQGWNELQTAARESRLNRFPATAVLAISDLMLYGRSERARQRLDALSVPSGESVLVDYLRGYALIHARRVDRAARVLEGAVDRARSEDYFYVDYLDYYLAQARMLQGRYEEAADLFRRYLGRHQGTALQATATLQLGICVEMHASWEAARSYYRLVSANRDFDSDKAAKRRAQRHARNAMTTVERRILRGRFAYDAGRYARADSLLRPLLDDDRLSDDEQAEVRYRLARTRHAQDRLGEALKLYQTVRNDPGDDRSKWGPYSRLYAGDIHAARGDTTRAEAAYEAAREWPTPYDYAASLDQTARLRLQAIQ